MSQVYEEEIAETKQSIREHLQDYPELEQEWYLLAREDVLRAERTALAEAVRAGLIPEEIEEELTLELNNRLAAVDVLKENRGLGGLSKNAPEASNE